MKRIILIIISILLMSTTLVFGATLNLRATWTANVETDMASYKLYRTDAGRVLIGTIPHPTVLYLFPITVPDGSQGVLTFVLTAVDTNNNESLDSNPASYTYNVDTIPPLRPGGLAITRP